MSTVSFRYSEEMGGFIIAGDVILDRSNATVTFQNQGSRSATISSFSSGFWTSTSNLPVGGNSTATKRRRTDLTDGATDQLRILINGISKFITLTYPNPPPPSDTVANPFTLPDVVVTPKTEFFIRLTVSGINTTVTATVSNATVTVNAQPTNRTSSPVVNGTRLTLTVAAPLDFRQSKTITIRVGSGPAQSFDVTTEDIFIDNKVVLTKSANESIGLREISQFFGGPSVPKITDFYPGLAYVPNIIDNEDIPLSGDLSLSDFRNAVTAFYFTTSPYGKAAVFNTLNGAVRGRLTFQGGDDFEMGYGAFTRINAKFKYSITREDGGNASDVNVVLSAGQNINVFSRQNNTIRLETARTYQNEEKIFFGKLTVFAQHPIDTSRIISRTVTWGITMNGQ